MRSFKSCACLASVILSILVIGQSGFCGQQPLDEKRAWEQLRKQIEQLYVEKRIPEAIQAAKDALAIARRAFGPHDYEYTSSYCVLGYLYQLHGERTQGELIEHQAGRGCGVGPLGLETNLGFDVSAHQHQVDMQVMNSGILKDSQMSVAYQGPTPCDLNSDGVCDQHDLELFRKQWLGKCNKEVPYNSRLDFDLDGCITEKDERIWFPNSRTDFKDNPDAPPISHARNPEAVLKDPAR